MQLARGLIAEAHDLTDCFKRGEATGDAAHRAEHAKPRAGVAILGIECVTDEAAVAGPVLFPATERPDLRLELPNRR